ncbi:hypothetical protein SAMN04489806_2514 [Paramicrobacterium humi]|uniref:Uncharacterized protein n=1 Tax=Paramicrobacterium humi TaxID=640635 RepID=A0A1H4PI00_9MICO|nr:hypothetical protein [Microbacterium humi]SEC07045.1 hypothetical protein SAMN04489806_2514 [Microbacterium humi]
MPGDNGYYDPVGYSPGWTWLAIAIIALVVAWFLFLWLSGPRRRRTVAPPVLTTEQVTQRYLGLVDEVEAAYASGDLSAREAHLKLSAILRLCAAERSGVPGSVMTLAELSEADVPLPPHTVAHYYPAEFAAGGDGDVETAAALAREAVIPWN